MPRTVRDSRSRQLARRLGRDRVRPPCRRSLLPLEIKDRRPNRLGPGPLAGRSQESARGPRVRQSTVDADVRPGDRENDRGFRLARALRRRIPKLLDWLAGEFIDSGWDVKHVLKLIVDVGHLSAIVASPREQLRQLDPDNRWLARQGRFRLDAELVRDNALAVSGLLSAKIGGPSVKPYQPAGYWRVSEFPEREWANDRGENQYRRGLYTFWQRTFLQPSLKAFDAPDARGMHGRCARGRTRRCSRWCCSTIRPMSKRRRVLRGADRAAKAARSRRSGIDWAFRQALVPRRRPPDESRDSAATLRASTTTNTRPTRRRPRSCSRVGDAPVAGRRRRRPNWRPGPRWPA